MLSSLEEIYVVALKSGVTSSPNTINYFPFYKTKNIDKIVAKNNCSISKKKSDVIGEGKYSVILHILYEH